MHLIEAMSRRQTKITLFIHYWMDSRGVKDGPTEADFPMELDDYRWETEFDHWERNILTDELMYEHTKPYEPPTEAGG